jgi:hypothetical protein
MQQSPIRRCAYCENPATTDDHIPPQSLLPGVPKSKRPKVPSCEACNTGASDDDEHVRDLIIMHHSVSDSQEASDALDKFSRSIMSPRKAGYVRSLQGRVIEVEAQTFEGICLGRQTGYIVDTDRFQRTYERYIKGLSWLEFGPPSAEILEVKVLLDPEHIHHRIDLLRTEFERGILKIISPKVFWYKYVKLGDEPSTTYWLTCHFGSFLVLSRTRILIDRPILSEG